MLRCFNVLLASCVLTLLAALTVHAEGEKAGGEIYGFQTLAVGEEGDNPFVDMSPGSDMLPYTEDDIMLPESGNAGGTWALAHFDSNSNGEIDLTSQIRDEVEEEVTEHTFTVLRRNDDDRYGFAAQSHPEFGVIYEAEDWVDYRDALGEGPTATIEGDDFDWEFNDNSGWDGETNAYLYNNLQANQHGKDKPRYYFESINPNSAAAADEPWVYDEVAGYRKRLTPVNPVDDPITALDERNTCRRDYFNKDDEEHVIKGYVVPVDDLETLEDGSLPTLFGWESVDLAAYFRDTLAPLLDDPGLTRYDDDQGSTDPALTLPITHLMLFQIQTPIAITSEDVCAGAGSVAAYWGITEDGGTLRVSHVMGFDAEATQILFGEDVKFWEDAPADDVPRNLWFLDHFWFDGDAPFDAPVPFPLADLPDTRWNTTAGPWEIVEDPGFAFVDTTPEKILRSTDAGLARATLPRALTAAEQPLELVVDVARVEGDVVQIGLLKNGEVLVYAEMTDDASTLFEGGSIGDDALSGGTPSDAGLSADSGAADLGEYTRVVLSVSPTEAKLSNESFGNYTTSQFTDLAGLPELASLTLSAENALAGADEVVISGGGSLFNTVLVLSALPGTEPPPVDGTQIAGDCNQDGSIDVNDVLCGVHILFVGFDLLSRDPQAPPCGDDAGNIAVMDVNGDVALNTADLVYLSNYLFSGGAAPAQGVGCAIVGVEESCGVNPGCQ